MQPFSASQSLKALRDQKRAMAQRQAPAAAYNTTPHYKKVRGSPMSLAALRAYTRAMIEQNELATARDADLSSAFTSLNIDVSSPVCHIWGLTDLTSGLLLLVPPSPTALASSLYRAVVCWQRGSEL
jgi:hypothetical protein